MSNINTAEVIAKLTGTDSEPIAEPAAPLLAAGRILSDEQIAQDVILGTVQELRITLNMLVERLGPLLEYAENFLNSTPTQRLKNALKK